MNDELSQRLTEQRNPNSAGIDTKSVPEMLDLFCDEDEQAARAVRAERENIARVIDWVESAFQNGGRLLYIGAGTSGRLGVLDASECPPTFGVSPELVVGIIAGGDSALRRSAESAEDNPNAGAEAMEAQNVSEKDVVVGIAASGRTPYVLGALKEAHRRGAKTALLSCTPPNESLREDVDGFITPLTGPELVTGSTRLKAGTATKLVLNQITTVAMIRTGRVYDNWMVAVRATNEKLVDRARRIVTDITGATSERAVTALAESEGSAKVAIVMIRLDVSAEEARKRLEANGGFLRGLL